MNLEGLFELRKTYEENGRELEDKEKEIKEEIERLTLVVEESTKRIKELRILKENIWESSKAIERRKIYANIWEELKKVNVYGVYNVRKIGKVLCKLARDITNVPFDLVMKLDNKKGFSCINNYAISYYRQVAYITVSEGYKDICPSWSFRFCMAEGPSDKDNISYGYNGSGTCANRMIREYEELITYNVSQRSFKNMNEKDVPDFIIDFLSFVSNYRLEHDKKDISIDELYALESKFYDEFGNKYSSYIEEKKELEKLLAERKAREEFEKIMDEGYEENPMRLFRMKLSYFGKKNKN